MLLICSIIFGFVFSNIIISKIPYCLQYDFGSSNDKKIPKKNWVIKVSKIMYDVYIGTCVSWFGCLSDIDSCWKEV